LYIQINEETNQDFLVSAYKHADTNEMVVVIVNSSIHEVEITVEHIAQSELKNFIAYLTDQNNNLTSMSLQGNRDIAIPARSIVTLTTQKP